MRKIDKHFVSEIDQQLYQFDANHLKSKSQQAEIAKYQKIFTQRDDPNSNIAQFKDENF